MLKEELAALVEMMKARRSPCMKNTASAVLMKNELALINEDCPYTGQNEERIAMQFVDGKSA